MFVGQQLEKNYESKKVKNVCRCGRTIYMFFVKVHLKTKIHEQMLKIVH